MTWNMANLEKGSADPAAVIDLKVNATSWTWVEEGLSFLQFYAALDFKDKWEVTDVRIN